MGIKKIFLYIVYATVAVLLLYVCVNLFGKTVKIIRLGFLPKCEEIKDDSERFNCWTKRAKIGEDEAQFNLGAMYYDGKGVTRDYEKAAEWFNKAADQGHKKSQFILGTMYISGRGVPKNQLLGAIMFAKSAEGTWLDPKK